MPFPLNGVQTADDYDDACAFEPDKNTQQIVFVGLGASYYVQAYKLDARMSLSSPVPDGIERLYPAGGGDSFTGPIAGAKFRSAVAGEPATIYGQQSFKTDIISASPVFGGSGNFPPIFSNVFGVIDATGAIISGSGNFIVAHTGTGIYTVTYDTTFNTVPAVTVTPTVGGHLRRVSSLAAQSTASFQVFILDATDTPADTGFDFQTSGGQ